MSPLEAINFQHDGLRFAGLAAGRGDPLVLLHGGGSRASNFATLMAHLSKDFRVYAYDQRGFGATGALPTSDITHQAWANDVDAFLDHIGTKRAFICGWSLGATVALNYASLRPERVIALALLGAPHPNRPINRALFKRRLDLIASGATAASVVEQTFSTIAQSFSPWIRANRPEAIEQVRQEHLSHDIKLAARVVEGYDTRPDFNEILAKMKCPVHLFVGADDKNCDLSGAEELQRNLEQADITIVPDCGHYYAVEQPEAVARLMSAALKKKEAA